MSGLKDNPNFETNTLKIWRSHKKKYYTNVSKQVVG